jgi:hypothetical protein
MYQEKYIKYKLKYLNLKKNSNMIGGNGDKPPSSTALTAITTQDATAVSESTEYSPTTVPDLSKPVKVEHKIRHDSADLSTPNTQTTTVPNNEPDGNLNKELNSINEKIIELNVLIERVQQEVNEQKLEEKTTTGSKPVTNAPAPSSSTPSSSMPAVVDTTDGVVMPKTTMTTPAVSTEPANSDAMVTKKEDMLDIKEAKNKKYYKLKNKKG